MAKKHVEVMESDEEVQIEDLSPEEQDVLAALTDIEGSQEARWQIYRIAPSFDGRPTGFLDTLSSPELRLEELQRRFGRGKYRIKGLRPNGTYIKTATVDIATDPPKNEATAPKRDDSKDILTILGERDERRAERSRELMLAVIPGAITAVAGIFTAMLSRQQPQNNVLQDVATLKTVLGSHEPRESNLDTVFKALELGMKSSGKGGDGSTWLDVVKEAVTMAGPMLQEKLSSTQPAPRQIPAPVQVANQSTLQPQIPAPTVEPGTDTVNNPMKLINWARETLGFLAKKAAANADIELYVDYVLDNVPEGVDIREFVGYLNHAQWWQYLQQFCPAVAPYNGWFDQFREVLVGSVAEMFAPQAALGQGPDHTNDSGEEA